MRCVQDLACATIIANEMIANRNFGALRHDADLKIIKGAQSLIFAHAIRAWGHALEFENEFCAEVRIKKIIAHRRGASQFRRVVT